MEIAGSLQIIRADDYQKLTQAIPVCNYRKKKRITYIMDYNYFQKSTTRL